MPHRRFARRHPRELRIRPRQLPPLNRRPRLRRSRIRDHSEERLRHRRVQCRPQRQSRVRYLVVLHSARQRNPRRRRVPNFHHRLPRQLPLLAQRSRRAPWTKLFVDNPCKFPSAGRNLLSIIQTQPSNWPERPLAADSMPLPSLEGIQMRSVVRIWARRIRNSVLMDGLGLPVTRK